MLKKLTASASLASALTFYSLAAAAPPARGAQDSTRARPAPPAGLPPAPELPPAVSPAPELPSAGPGTWGGYAARNPSDYEERPFSARDVSRKAVITSKPEPGFTKEARENATFGLARLRAVLGKDGKVSHILVVKGLPDGLTEKAMAAARGIKFRPAQKDGRAVSQWVTLEYNFNIYADEELDRKAVVHEQPAPVYTGEAPRTGETGRAVVEVALWSDGTVGARVVEAQPDWLGGRALEAARKIRFTPAEKDGRKVSVVRRVEYRFPPERARP